MREKLIYIYIYIREKLIYTKQETNIICACNVLAKKKYD
jgi:hypothetical protein